MHDELPIDDELRWLMDYDEALRTGMAITATDADMSAGTLAEGLDTLVVLGVDWSRGPEAAAEALDAQLAAKRASDGLSFIAAGTPTNNTGESPAPVTTPPPRSTPSTPPPPAGPQSAGRRAERALGLQGRSVARAAAPGAGALDDDAARHMANVLWPTTWGYFLDQIMRAAGQRRRGGRRARALSPLRARPRPAPHDPRRSPALRACCRSSLPGPGRETTRSCRRSATTWRTPACCGSAPS